MWKSSDNLTEEQDILQHIWPVFLKNVPVIKNQETITVIEEPNVMLCADGILDIE